MVLEVDQPLSRFLPVHRSVTVVDRPCFSVVLLRGFPPRTSLLFRRSRLIDLSAGGGWPTFGVVRPHAPLATARRRTYDLTDHFHAYDLRRYETRRLLR